MSCDTNPRSRDYLNLALTRGPGPSVAIAALKVSTEHMVSAITVWDGRLAS
jgi:hypothetical protein